MGEKTYDLEGGAAILDLCRVQTLLSLFFSLPPI